MISIAGDAPVPWKTLGVSTPGLLRRHRRRVGALDLAEHHPERALALQRGVVVRVALDDEHGVGGVGQILVLVGVKVERHVDRDGLADDRPHAPDHLGLRLRHARDRHRAVQREVDAVERSLRLDVVGDAVGVLVEGLQGEPAARGAALRVARREDARSARRRRTPSPRRRTRRCSRHRRAPPDRGPAARRTPTRRCRSGRGRTCTSRARRSPRRSSPS